MVERYSPDNNGQFHLETTVIPEADQQEDFGRIFRSVGNSAAKAVTLCCMSEGEPLTAVGLWQKFKRETGWQRIGKMTPIDYLHGGFIEAGLVVGDEVCRHDEAQCTTGFRLTDLGVTAQAYAAYLLSESVRFAYPLNRIFGSSGTNREGGSRAVENRALILEVLAKLKEGESLRTVDMANKLGLQPTVVGGNLKFLRDISRGKSEEPISLVNYVSVGPEDPGFAKYAPLEGARLENVKTIDGRQALTEAISQLMFERGVLDAVTAAALLKDKFPNIRRDILEDAASHILAGLSVQEITYPVQFVGKKKQSEVSITDLGMEVYNKFINPLRNLLKGDQALFKDWQKISWQDYSLQALARHFDASSHTNEGKETVARIVFEEVQKNPGVRPVELEEKLGIADVSPYLRSLFVRRAIKAVREGRKLHIHAI